MQLEHAPEDSVESEILPQALEQIPEGTEADESITATRSF
jgi:hypothetical protein